MEQWYQKSVNSLLTQPVVQCLGRVKRLQRKQEHIENTMDRNHSDFLTYVSADNRLIAMDFHNSSTEDNTAFVAKALHSCHSDHFMVWNFSGKIYDYAAFDHRVIECPCSGHSSPPLPLLCNACAAIDQWLVFCQNCIYPDAFLSNYPHVCRSLMTVMLRWSTAALGSDERTLYWRVI